MLYIIIAAVIAVGDQIFKHWALKALADGETISLIPGVIRLLLVKNDGVSFGLLGGMMLPIIILTLIISVIIAWAFVTRRFKFRMEKVGATLVLGGAIGNLVDRIGYGFVIDMFSTEFINFPVFNIADIMITVGCVIFCVSYILGDVRHHREMKSYAETKRDAEADEALLGRLSAFKPEICEQTSDIAEADAEAEKNPEEENDSSDKG